MGVNGNHRTAGRESNPMFKEWADTNHIKFHPDLSIEQSLIGGTGLFFNSRQVNTEDLEILRIPSEITFDYLKLLGVLEGLKEIDRGLPDNRVRESKIIVNTLELIEPKSETEILSCYFWGFKICYELRKVSKEEQLQRSPLARFDQYLEVLENTEVVNYPGDDKLVTHDEFVDKLIAKARNIRHKYNEFVDELNKETGMDVKNLLTFESFYQIHQAIKSRALEIPSGEEHEENFFVNVTLVPILDFANHNHENNSYFDIDKSTKDVLLKLKPTETTGKFEITISYSPIESVQHFIETYGFIPELCDGDFQLFELKLLNLNNFLDHSNDYDLICKWLKILPQIQLVYGSNKEVYINFFNNNLPLLFIQGLKYNPAWKNFAIAEFNRFNKIEAPSDQHDYIINMLKYQEDNCDYINGVDAIGVTFNNRPIELENILEQTGNVSDVAFNQLVMDAITFIIDYCKRKLPTSKQHHSADNFMSLVNSYFQYQSKILQLLVEKEHERKSLILPDEKANIEWETNYRTSPKQINIQQMFE